MQNGLMVPTLDIANAGFHSFQRLAIWWREVDHGVVGEAKRRAWYRVICIAVAKVQRPPLSACSLDSVLWLKSPRISTNEFEFSMELIWSASAPIATAALALGGMYTPREVYYRGSLHFMIRVSSSGEQGSRCTIGDLSWNALLHILYIGILGKRFFMHWKNRHGLIHVFDSRAGQYRPTTRRRKASVVTPSVDIPNKKGNIWKHTFYLVIVLKLICQRCINSSVSGNNHVLTVKGEYAPCIFSYELCWYQS